MKLSTTADLVRQCAVKSRWLLGLGARQGMLGYELPAAVLIPQLPLLALLELLLVPEPHRLLVIPLGDSALELTRPSELVKMLDLSPST